MFFHTLVHLCKKFVHLSNLYPKKFNFSFFYIKNDNKKIYKTDELNFGHTLHERTSQIIQTPNEKKKQK